MCMQMVSCSTGVEPQVPTENSASEKSHSGLACWIIGSGEYLERSDAVLTDISSILS